MTLIQFILILIVANVLAVGFHIELGLGIIKLHMHFRGIFCYVFPDRVMNQDIAQSKRTRD